MASPSYQNDILPPEILHGIFKRLEGPYYRWVDLLACTLSCRTWYKCAIWFLKSMLAEYGIVCWGSLFERSVAVINSPNFTRLGIMGLVPRFYATANSTAQVREGDFNRMLQVIGSAWNPSCRFDLCFNQTERLESSIRLLRVLGPRLTRLTLTLRSDWEECECVLPLDSLVNLQEIKFYGFCLHQPVIVALARCTSLQTLIIKYPLKLDVQAMVTAIPSWPALHHFAISINLRYVPLVALAPLVIQLAQSCSKLKQFEIAIQGVTTGVTTGLDILRDALVNLVHLQGKWLTQVHMNGLLCVNDAVLDALIAEAPELEFLDLRGSGPLVKNRSPGVWPALQSMKLDARDHVGLVEWINETLKGCRVPLKIYRLHGYYEYYEYYECSEKVSV